MTSKTLHSNIMEKIYVMIDFPVSPELEFFKRQISKEHNTA